MRGRKKNTIFWETKCQFFDRLDGSPNINSKQLTDPKIEQIEGLFPWFDIVMSTCRFFFLLFLPFYVCSVNLIANIFLVMRLMFKNVTVFKLQWWIFRERKCSKTLESSMDDSPFGNNYHICRMYFCFMVARTKLFQSICTGYMDKW